MGATSLLFGEHDPVKNGNNDSPSEEWKWWPPEENGEHDPPPPVENGDADPLATMERTYAGLPAVQTTEVP